MKTIAGTIVACLILAGCALVAADPETAPTLVKDKLWNGWGMTPAGQHVPISGDLALKMIVSPDHKRLVAVTGGYTNQGLTLLDIESRKVTQYLPMVEACYASLHRISSR